MQFPGSFRGFLIVRRPHRTHTGGSFGGKWHVAEVLNGTSVQVGPGIALPLHRVPVPHPIPLPLPAAVAIGAIQGLCFVLIPVNGVPLARIVVRMLLLLAATASTSAATMPELPVVIAPAHGAQFRIGVGMTHGGT